MKLSDIVFLGEVDNDRIPELMNCSDVFAFCSLYEGSPTVTKEALACNLPVVSVDVGDVRHVIEDINGCYIAEPDVHDFSHKILNVLSERKRPNVRIKVLKYSSEKVAQKTLKIYRSLQRELVVG